jgi:hypothetical protein
MTTRLIKPAGLYVDLGINEALTAVLDGISEIEGNYGPRKILELTDSAGRARKMGAGGFLTAIIPELVIGQAIEIKRIADRPTSKGQPMKTYEVRQWPVEEGQGPIPEADEESPFSRGA